MFHLSRIFLFRILTFMSKQSFCLKKNLSPLPTPINRSRIDALWSKRRVFPFSVSEIRVRSASVWPCRKRDKYVTWMPCKAAFFWEGGRTDLPLVPLVFLCAITYSSFFYFKKSYSRYPRVAKLACPGKTRKGSFHWSAVFASEFRHNFDWDVIRLRLNHIKRDLWLYDMKRYFKNRIILFLNFCKRKGLDAPILK